jgi:hypothetical protein
MSDPADIKRQYRRFADVECKGYSEVYYRLATWWHSSQGCP